MSHFLSCGGFFLLIDRQVPIIARALLARPEGKSINLAGIATGDGCLGIDVLCGSNNLGLGAPW